jgi:hypothetical protein
MTLLKDDKKTAGKLLPRDGKDISGFIYPEDLDRIRR